MSGHKLGITYKLPLSQSHKIGAIGACVPMTKMARKERAVRSDLQLGNIF